MDEADHAIETLVQHFGAVEGLRCRGKILHHLDEILVIALACLARISEPGKARRSTFRHPARPRLPRSENVRHDLRSVNHPAHA
jgi:hypothetical protein